MKKTILALLIAAPTVAHAADGRLTVDAQKFTQGKVAGVGSTATYKVRLTKGQDYAVRASGGGEFGEECARLTVRDPSGKLLATDGKYPSCEGEWRGYEVHAAQTGDYLVQVQNASYGPSDGFGFSVGVAPDCRYDNKTTCKIKPGATRQALIAFVYDVDFYRVDLSAKRTYTITLDSVQNTILSVVDAKYRELASAEYGDPIAGFRPPRDGTYFIVVEGDEEKQNPTQPYVLKLRQK